MRRLSGNRFLFRGLQFHHVAACGPHLALNRRRKFGSQQVDTVEPTERFDATDVTFDEHGSGWIMKLRQLHVEPRAGVGGRRAGVALFVQRPPLVGVFGVTVESRIDRCCRENRIAGSRPKRMSGRVQSHFLQQRKDDLTVALALGVRQLDAALF